MREQLGGHDMAVDPHLPEVRLPSRHGAREEGAQLLARRHLGRDVLLPVKSDRVRGNDAARLGMFHQTHR